MSKCELVIRLDGDRRSYAPGDSITGSVEVTVHSKGSCCCKELTVALRWHVPDVGGRSEDGVGDGNCSALLGQGEWQAGQTLSFPFTLTAPEGLLSYDGELFTLSWAIEAKAVVSLGLDVAASETITLVAPPVTPRPDTDGDTDTGVSDAASEIPTPLRQGIGWNWRETGLGLAGLGLAMMIMSIHPPSPAEGWLSVPGGMVIGSFGVGAVLVIHSILSAMARIAVGRPRLLLEPFSPHLGNTLKVHVLLHPKKNLTVCLATLEITACEIVTRPPPLNYHAKYPLVHTVVLHTQTVKLEPRTIPGGKESRITWCVPLPADGVPSLQAPDHHVVQWTLALQLEALGLAGWNTKLSFRVLP
ncbi:MAG: hypothetical protein GXP62_20760 [Oligoflexia bacterium]|nr:hypothetical protein [Oligoflexia bacterium]